MPKCECVNIWVYFLKIPLCLLPDNYFLLFCSNEVGAEAKNPGRAKVFGMLVLGIC